MYHTDLDILYNETVHILSSCAEATVPKSHKNFSKFWWDEELTILKQASTDTNKIWKAAGKPRQGHIFDKRQSCCLLYRSANAIFGKIGRIASEESTLQFTTNI